MANSDQPEPDTVETLFIADRERLIQIACRIVESRAIAEEIVQESWIRWHGRNYRPDQAGPIFRRIVANLATDWYRATRSERSVMSDIYAMRGNVPSTESAVIARNELAIIVKTISNMSDSHIKAFRKRTLHGKKYKEIAEDLGVSVGYAFRLIEQVMVEIYLALDP
ncbi:MAG: sigma-70 family RNA polymerase sigma factor [Pseudomonadota bacterium]